MDARMSQAVDNAAFRQLLARLAQDSGRAPDLATPASFEMVLADTYPVRVTVHPEGDRLVTDIYLYNSLMLSGPLRANVVRSLLLLNHVAMRGRRFALAIDNRGFLLLTATRPLDDSTAEAFNEDLQYLLAQARRARELIEEVSLARHQPVVDIAGEPA